MKRLIICVALFSFALPGCRSTRVVGPTAPGLVIVDLAVGNGAIARAGDVLIVNYVGWLDDGTKFDSTYNPGRRPFNFRLGAHQVIRGWDLGIAGMRVHGKRQLWIPPNLAYGAVGAPPAIPPDARLLFNVELLEVQPLVTP